MARKIKNIKANKEFLIITNGKQSEYNYFSLIKKFKSIYDITVKFENGGPLELVEFAITQSNLEEYNQIWIVFDVDQTHVENKFIPAIKKAEKNNIKYAFSNIAFEVWLLSHYSKFSKHSSAKELQNKMDELLKQLKCKSEYTKNDDKLLEKYFIEKYQTAVDNSKIVFQTKLKHHNEFYGKHIPPKYWEWNSCTNVFKLVEAMKLEKKFD